jgi:hypothetical protein
MTVFLKQYGEKRTGTNFLRALLLMNYENAVPLMHVLGDKHSAPVPFDDYWDRVKDAPDAARQFVTLCTRAAPAETTAEDDAAQRRHLEEIEIAVGESFDAGRLGFLISIKHPYAWVSSLARFSRWTIRVEGRLQVPAEAAALVEAACREFNRKYAAWREHARRHPRRSRVVRYEDALTKPEVVLGVVARQFGLQARHPVFQVPRETVLPARWDHSPVNVYERPFNPAFYRERRFMAQLTAPIRDVVDRTIDWPLVEALGYEPTAGR